MSRKRIHRNEMHVGEALSPSDAALFRDAWDTAREYHGDEFVFYLPGMIRIGRLRGRYPAVSITGKHCELLCEHCKGKLLEPMVKTQNPEELLKVATTLFRNGAHGLLLTGGSDLNGMLPWTEFSEVIKRVSGETGLFLSAHTGFPDRASCKTIKASGIRQALIDVIGDPDTARRIYHIESLAPLYEAMDGLKENDLELVPHIVAGLRYGKIESEENALEIVNHYEPQALVIVSLTPLRGTPMEQVASPSPIEVSRLIARARLLMPRVPISLGCERPRNREGWLMEDLAIRAGATRMAIWSEHAVQAAMNLGLEVKFQATCCSLPLREEFRIQ